VIPKLNDDLKDDMIKQLHQHIDDNCLFRCNPSVHYSECCEAGRLPTTYEAEMSFQFFLRRLTHDAKMMTYVSALFIHDLFEKIETGFEHPHIQLCGLESSSIPIMIAMQAYAARFNININSFSIRKERKSYGLFNLIDGKPTDAPVVIVDDIINSGKSIGSCIDVCLYELNIKPAKNCYSIVKFNQLMESIEYKQHKVDLTSIFVVDDFNVNYSKEKYWLPKDCDKIDNKRPDYF
jgi:orotate phosphoribosyltransferase